MNHIEDILKEFLPAISEMKGEGPLKDDDTPFKSAEDAETLRKAWTGAPENNVTFKDLISNDGIAQWGMFYLLCLVF